MLPNISYTPLDEFSINIGAIHVGWMDIDVCDGVKNSSYVASYTTDPLNDLLEATVCALSGKPYIDRIGNKINNYYYIDHDMEGATIYWVFDVEGDTLRLTIWEEPPCALVEYWDAHCDKESFEYDELINDYPVLPAPIFAVEGSAKTFGRILHNVLEELDTRTDNEPDFNGWGYNYSQEQFEQLCTLINNGDS